MIAFLLEGLFEVIIHLDGSLSTENVQQSAAQYTLVLGSIADEPTGVIHDPAGSAIGTGCRPTGGGLSGAIYRLYPLDPIPDLAPCESILNSADGVGGRILHTHSPAIFNADDIWEAVCQISTGYYSALVEFIKTYERHGESTLNLCALAAGILRAGLAILNMNI